MYIALLMLVPLIIGIVGLVLSKTGRADAHLSLKEFATMEAAVLALILAGYAISRWSAVRGTELISGRVTSKEQNIVSCSHSYECNCHEVCSGSGSSRSCSNECGTCYEHLHDYDWDVDTNAMGKSFSVDRGAHMPDEASMDKLPTYVELAQLLGELTEQSIANLHSAQEDRFVRCFTYNAGQIPAWWKKAIETRELLLKNQVL